MSVDFVNLEIHDTKVEELDIEAALNFATHALSNAALFWNQCSADQKLGFKEFSFLMV